MKQVQTILSDMAQSLVINFRWARKIKSSAQARLRIQTMSAATSGGELQRVASARAQMISSCARLSVRVFVRQLLAVSS